MRKQILPFLLGAIAMLASCTSNPTTDIQKPTIVEKPFGDFEGHPVTQYTLTNAAGMQVSIINYGGTLTSIMTPDKDKKMGDVILGFDSLSGYLQAKNPYFGALIGRYGNRIAKGKFTIDGQTYQLPINNNGNTLHGGLKGFDKVVWEAGKPAGDSSLSLSYNSKDGEQGFPGNVKVTVVYTLTADNSLQIDYTATTDKATPINLTNHAYFNLSAGKEATVLDHDVMIKADKYTAVDTVLIPTGKLPDVKGTPMDFTTAKKIGKDIGAVKGGYDHNWALNKKGSDLESVATVYDAASGRFLEVFTTQPGLQFYTGNFLDSTLTGKYGRVYPQHAALCLETQHFPDGPNQPSFPNTILKPGETYHHVTRYQFSVK